MICREIIAVCSHIHTKHINTLCGENVELSNVKLVVHIVTIGLWSDLFTYVRKISKSEINFFVFFCPSVCRNEITRLPLDGFSLNLILLFFFKSAEKIKVSLKSLYIKTSVSIRDNTCLNSFLNDKCVRQKL